MSKRGYISRYLLILKKLKTKAHSSYEEVQSYMDTQFDYLQMQDGTLNIGFSKRTLQRDIKEIRSLFGIDIEYSKKDKGYFIQQNERESMNFQRMMEAFDMFNSLNFAQNLTPFVHFENRRPQGTEHLYGLLYAIQNKWQVKFSYQKFWEYLITQRTVDPYALKEFKNRWYLMAKDNKDGRVKSFGLDRLSDLEITNIHLKIPATLNTEEEFRYCFGILTAEGKEPQDIILSFDPVQGKYIKSLPLHETQQILVDNDEELRIQLKLFITHDLLMELLSYGDSVRVLKPQSLADDIKTAHQKASNQYRHEQA